MKFIANFFVSGIICLAFLFRLLAVSFLPGSTATVFPHTASFKYKGLSSFQKRRRHTEGVCTYIENSATGEYSVLTEECTGFIRKSLVAGSRILPAGTFRFESALLNTLCRFTCEIHWFFSPFLQQRKLLSVSILRI